MPVPTAALKEALQMLDSYIHDAYDGCDTLQRKLDALKHLYAELDRVCASCGTASGSLACLYCIHNPSNTEKWTPK